jgi:hypothetical protein
MQAIFIMREISRIMVWNIAPAIFLWDCFNLLNRSLLKKLFTNYVVLQYPIKFYFYSCFLEMKKLNTILLVDDDVDDQEVFVKF